MISCSFHFASSWFVHPHPSDFCQTFFYRPSGARAKFFLLRMRDESTSTIENPILRDRPR